MKLSQLVEYYQQLKSYDINNKAENGLDLLRVLRNTVKDNKVPTAHSKIRFGDTTYVEQIEQDIEDYKLTVSSIRSNLNFYINQIRENIIELDTDYLHNSREVYDKGMKHDSPDTILNRKLDIPSDAEKTLRNRLSVYSDWRFPGLCLGPMRTSLVDEMMSSDPLYLCDIDEELINPLVESYNDVYKHRVRPYVIPRYENGKKIFKDLPTGQFSIIFSSNFFEYVPLEGIEKILSEMKDLLRPGGTIVFTFNDCDNPKNIQLAERNFRTYTPKRLLADIVQDIGFSIIFAYDASFGFSWMEIKKPGELETIRGGQSLASVISVGDVIVDSGRAYTQEEIDFIHLEAQGLGIEIGDLNPGKLELLIKRRKHAIEEERKMINDIGEQNSKDD